MAKFDQKGFGAVGVLLLFIAVGAIAGTGWFVYKQRADNKPSNASQPNGTQEVAEKTAQEEKVKIPEGWVAYKDVESGVSFYHPKQWESDAFKVQTYQKHEPIPGFSADSVVFGKENTWGMYVYHGSEDQKPRDLAPSDEYGLKTVALPVSEFPLAHRKLAHAAVVTHDIYAIHGVKAYRVRLPEINAFDPASNWKEQAAEQAAALPDILKTLRFN